MSVRDRGPFPGGMRRQRPTEGNLDIRKIGGNIYEAHPTTRPFVGTGFLADFEFQIPEAFRVNKVDLIHVDAAGAPTGVAWIADFELQDMSGVWMPVFERAVTTTSIVEELGVEYNWRQRRGRFRTSCVLTDLIYATITLQYLEGVPYNG